MAVAQFGNTWWGGKWLDALMDTEYSNRLPRGKTYARNGSVTKIDLSGPMVTAEVRGSRPYPYRVRIELPSFTSSEKKVIIDEIASNPFFLSQLLSRRLPPAMFDVVVEEDIPLFPDTWDDLSALCSCPDWAPCCKHIAAVIYLIANEVDKNPFVLFDLHEFDLIDALAERGHSAEKHSNVDIASMNQLILKQAPAKTDQMPREQRDQLLNRLDFSQIPAVRAELLSLLADRPLFCLERDFKLVLDKALKKFERQIIRQTRWWRQAQENSDDVAPLIYVNLSFIIDDDLNMTSAVLATSDKTHATGENISFEFLFRLLFIVPRKTLQSQGDRVVAASLLVHFALRLIEQGAIMPEFLETTNGYRVRWVPAVVSDKVSDMFDAICALSPHNLLEEPHLAPAEQAKIVLSGIIGHYVSLFADDVAECRGGGIMDVFFKGQVLKKSGKFEDREIPENIAMWLNRFRIARKEYVPLIKIDETDDGFALDVLVENRKTQMDEPLALNKILKLKKFATAKYDILKDVMLLADYLPEIGEFVASYGQIRPSFSPLDFEEVLFRHLPTLRLLNIRILLPKGLERLIRPRISATVTKAVSETTKCYLSADNIFSFEWQVALGDRMLSAAEFEKLVRGYRGIVKLNDQFVFLDRNDIGKILADLGNQRQLTSKAALKAVLAEQHEGASLRLDENVRKTINELLGAEPLPVPNTLHATLRDYQQRGFEWLAKNARLGFGSLIADDMGLGKTIQVITLLLKLLHDGRFEQHPALVVVPTTLLTNWRRELEKFAPSIKVHTYHGNDRQFETEGIHVFLTTYGLLRRDERMFLPATWAAVIIDEAQNIKNHGTAQTKAIKKIKSDLRIAMTGTPVENRLTEYWSILDFLNNGYLAGVKAFKTQFAMPIEVDRDQKKLEQFRKITAPFILRRLKSDRSIIKDLPDKLEIDQYCQLGKKQAALYQTTMDHIMHSIDEADGIERRGLILKLITALKQICNHPSHFLKHKTIDPEASGKTAILLDLLRTVFDNEEKVLIFTQYTEMGNLLHKLITAEFAIEPLFLHGGVSRKKRDDMVDDFQNKPYVKCMLLSLKAGGTGLNLTAAQNVVHFDLWWNPAVEAQATDRAYRIGQTENVMVHRLITNGTFEEKINDMLKDKRELANLTVASGEKWIGEYSNSDLRDLFALG